MALTRRRPLYVVGPGAVVSRRGGRLVVTRDGVVVTSAPLAMLSEVVVFGAIPVTVPAMTALLAEHVPLVLLSADGRVRGRLESPSATHVELRRRQLERHADPADRLAVARAVVGGKIHNQDVLLRRRAARSPSPDSMWSLARRLAELRGRAAEARSVDELYGVEGAASGAYFQAMRLLLRPEYGFRRRDRAEPDVVNVLVNYCSALLREVVFGAIVAAGLDPYVSFLHVPRAGRPTLVFDLMEEWRPVLLETTVLALLGLRSVQPGHVGPRTPDLRATRRNVQLDAIADRIDVSHDGIGSPDQEFADLQPGPSDTDTDTETGSMLDTATATGTDRDLPGQPRLAPKAAAAAVSRFRTRLDAPARGWPDPGGRTYGAQLRAQALGLRAWVRDDEPYVPFAWR